MFGGADFTGEARLMNPEARGPHVKTGVTFRCQERVRQRPAHSGYFPQLSPESAVYEFARALEVRVRFEDCRIKAAILVRRTSGDCGGRKTWRRRRRLGLRQIRVTTRTQRCGEQNYWELESVSHVTLGVCACGRARNSAAPSKYTAHSARTHRRDHWGSLRRLRAGDEEDKGAPARDQPGVPRRPHAVTQASGDSGKGIETSATIPRGIREIGRAHV